MAELNKEKLLKTDFTIRFLDFIRRFDSVCKKDTFYVVQKWIKEEEYEYIKFFLFTSPIETMLPFSLHEFAKLSLEEFIDLHNFYVKVSDILKEKEALYKELCIDKHQTLFK